MPKWDEGVTKQQLEEMLGPEMTEKVKADARETTRLAKTVAAFVHEETRSFVRILYGPAPMIDPGADLPPSAMFKAFTVFWLGGPTSPWPPEDSPWVLAKGVDPTDGKHKFMGWLVKERETVIDLVKKYWNVDIELPAEVIS